jgi:hypothetical protein
MIAFALREDLNRGMKKRPTAPRPTRSAPAPDHPGSRLSPKDLRRLEEAEAILRELAEKLLPEDAPFGDYEQTVLEIMNEVARRGLERKLQSIADSHAPRLRIDHHEDWHGYREGTCFEYRRHLPGTVQYHSLVGELRVERYTYRELARNGTTHVPLDLEAGLMEHMTPGLAKALSFGHALMPAKQVGVLLRHAGLRPPSGSTIDRCARDLGAYAVACNAEFEPLVRAEEAIPDGAVAIALGADRTAVSMRNNDPGGEGAGVGRDLRRSRPKVRGGRSDKKGVSWRMDYVATVTFVDEEGKRLASRQYRVPADSDPVHAATRMMEDVKHALRLRPSLKVCIVQDGAPELWTLLRSQLRANPAVSKWHEVLDWYHAAERLAKCAELSSDAPSQRARLREEWKEILLEKSDGADRFIASLEQQTKRRLAPGALEDLRGHIDYFTRRRSLLCYRKTRAQGLPIGSGVTEGCCKSLVGARAKKGGQHWNQRGLTAALHLRSVVYSDRFEGIWGHFARRYRATSMQAVRLNNTPV